MSDGTPKPDRGMIRKHWWPWLPMGAFCLAALWVDSLWLRILGTIYLIALLAMLILSIELAELERDLRKGGA